ncbi:LysE family translocator [Salinicola endophyticus]|uniref:LysE family translocator n=1 Tax=Salinicola endophyticus TaxID=1949083 RepID=A0AB74UI06_9GAMM
MSLSLALSMAAFALAASLSPGPVNLVAFHLGLNRGLIPALRHVSGATCGFSVLLLSIGAGLQWLTQWAALMHAIRLGGVAFLLYLAWRLARSDGALTQNTAARSPSFVGGALMQWLNPKAWIASGAGMAAYTAGDPARAVPFALIFFGVCYLSVGSWALLGAGLRRRLPSPERVRWLNRGMGLALLVSALMLATMSLHGSGAA